jgi:uncharacterized protein (TIGR03435 family)
MIQSLLEDRFQLKLHHDTKELPIYVLVLAKKDGKLGPGITETKAEGCTTPDPARAPPPPEPGKPPVRFCGQMMMGPKHISAVAVPVANLIPMISRLLGRSVIDNTGLTGNYDIEMDWTPDESLAMQFPPAGTPPPSGPPAASEPAGPNIFTAFQEQLGLKLEPRKGPVDILVIDHAEKPAGN